MAKHEVTGIKKDAIIKIEVGGGFYFRLAQFVTFYTARTWAAENLETTLEELQTRKPETDEEYHLITLMSLIHEIEESAKKQDMIITEEVDFPDPGSDTPETSPEN